MAIVVEIISRGGVVMSSQVFRQSVVRIGRAFDCDIVLHDPHVDAHHLQLQRDEQTSALTCADLQTLNGSWAMKMSTKGHILSRTKKITGSLPFFSGQVFQIGKTFLRIYDSAHHLTPTLPLSPWEEVAHALGHWWVYMTLLFLYVALQVWNGYVSNPLAEQLSQDILRAGYPLLGGFVYAGIFAFLGKNYKHDPKLSSHFAVAIGALLAISCIHFVAPYVAYFFRAGQVQGAVSDLCVAAVIFGGGYISLSLATPLKYMARAIGASVVPAALIITLLINQLASADFKSYANYDRTLVSPAWQYRGETTVVDFMAEVDKLYGVEIGPK